MIAQADATVYGSLRVQVTDADGSELDIQDNTSRIGIKATSELFSGATAIAHFETYVNTESGAFGTPAKGRLAYVGATGDFGTVTVGRQWLPAYLWTVGKTDIMAAASTETTHSYGTGGRQGNAAAYISPDLGGLKIAAAVVARDAAGVDAGGNTPNDIDASHLAANYSMGGFGVALSTLQYDLTSSDDTINSLGLSYSAGDLYVGLSVEDDEINRADEVIVLAGSYAMGNTKVLGSFTDFGKDGSDNGSRYVAEVQQKLGNQAFVFANYIEADSDAEAEAQATDTFAIGYNVSF
jgi:predicted porin